MFVSAWLGYIQGVGFVLKSTLSLQLKKYSNIKVAKKVKN